MSLEAAREALLAADVVCPHTDANGLAAGALAMLARGERAEDALLLSHTRTPWGPDPDLPDARVALLDQGVRPFARAGVLVDHHVPDTDDAGPGVVVLTSHGETPEVPTAPLTRRALGGPAWLAAVGGVGDLGKAALSLPECAGTPVGPVTKLVPLVNAPRRCADGPVATALALLVDHAPDGAAAALADPRIAELQEAKAAAKAAFDRAVRTAPRFHGEVAVLRMDEPFQVHPLVATAWMRRLKPRPVLAANDGWVPGRVNFSIRCADDRDLRALLRDAFPEHTGNLGHGHRAATGGSLPPDEFEALVAGFRASAADRSGS